MPEEMLVNVDAKEVRLRLVNPEKARVYGLPLADTTVAAILEEYRAAGWEDEAIRRHIGCALAAKAYEIITDAAEAPATEVNHGE